MSMLASVKASSVLFVNQVNIHLAIHNRKYGNIEQDNILPGPE